MTNQLLILQAAIDSVTDSNAPQVGYASVYPVALVAIILAAQAIRELG